MARENFGNAHGIQIIQVERESVAGKTPDKMILITICLDLS